jgi:hypothetical protein
MLFDWQRSVLETAAISSPLRRQVKKAINGPEKISRECKIVSSRIPNLAAGWYAYRRSALELASASPLIVSVSLHSPDTHEFEILDHCYHRFFHFRRFHHI